MPASSASRKAVSNSLVALSGGALALNLLLIAGLILLIAVNGLGTFWQKRVVELTLVDGTRLLGEIHDREPLPSGEGTRIRLAVGNRDLTGQDFLWVDERRVAARDEPRDALVLERLEWGKFYGRAVEIRRGDELLASGPGEVWTALETLLRSKRSRVEGDPLPREGSHRGGEPRSREAAPRLQAPGDRRARARGAPASRDGDSPGDLTAGGRVSRAGGGARGAPPGLRGGESWWWKRRTGRGQLSQRASWCGPSGPTT